MINQMTTGINCCGKKINSALDKVYDVTGRILPKPFQAVSEKYKIEAKVMMLWLAASALIYETSVCLRNASPLNITSAFLMSMTAIPLFVAQTSLSGKVIRNHSSFGNIIVPVAATTVLAAFRCFSGFHADVVMFFLCASVNLAAVNVSGSIEAMLISPEEMFDRWSDENQQKSREYFNAGVQIKQFINENPELFNEYKKFATNDPWISKVKFPIRDDFDLNDAGQRADYYFQEMQCHQRQLEELKSFLQRHKPLWTLFQQYVRNEMRENQRNPDAVQLLEDVSNADSIG